MQRYIQLTLTTAWQCPPTSSWYRQPHHSLYSQVTVKATLFICPPYQVSVWAESFCFNPVVYLTRLIYERCHWWSLIRGSLEMPDQLLGWLTCGGGGSLMKYQWKGSFSICSKSPGFEDIAVGLMKEFLYSMVPSLCSVMFLWLCFLIAI